MRIGTSSKRQASRLRTIPPLVTKQERESFLYLLRDSGREDYAVTVSWWVAMDGECGNTQSMWGVVKWIDPQSRKVQLVNEKRSEWIELEQIVNVRG
ncbi:YolD-like family protein [Brevibacillus gelatini]|uniref:YolD-like family protein n=1 Tax=Brevibacillus gelatini TaxID=1655277 RepID=UPI003D81AA33